MLARVLSPLIGVEEWLLEGVHALGAGWGIAIVVLTLLVRVLTVPLTASQLRSQRELREHLPELKRLQQRYKHDRARLQRAMADYYRRHGINPLKAFAPLLVQIPIFISLYYVLRSDVSRGLFGDAGFLFIPSLGDKPHGAVLLALVLGYLCSQLASSAIATRTLARGHRGVVLALPLLFVGVVARFPAGLAVYWITSSLWTLGQQLAIWRLAPAAASAADPAAPPAPASPLPAPRSRSRANRRKRKKRKR